MTRPLILISVVLGLHATLCFSHSNDLVVWLNEGVCFTTSVGIWIVKGPTAPNFVDSHVNSLFDTTPATVGQQEEVLVTPHSSTGEVLLTPLGTSVQSVSQPIFALAEAVHQQNMNVVMEPTRMLRSQLRRIPVRIKTPTQYRPRARNPFILYDDPGNLEHHADTIQAGGDEENKENEPPWSVNTAHLPRPTPPSKKRKLLVKKTSPGLSKTVLARPESLRNEDSDTTAGNCEAATKNSEASSTIIAKPITQNTRPLEEEDTSRQESLTTSIHTPPVSSRLSTIRVNSSQAYTSISPFKNKPSIYRVCLSGSCRIPKKHQVIQSFKKLGGSIVSDLEDATILCVSSQQSLTKTAKFLLAIATGMDIIYDEWLIQSAEQERILPLAVFIPEDEDKEREWQVKLEDAVSQGKRGLGHILKGHVVHITSSLKKELKSTYDSYSRMARVLGTDDMRLGLPSRRTRSTALIIGTANDKDIDEVAGLQKYLWSKDLLSMTILRGQLQTHDHSLRVGVLIKKEEEEEC